MPTAYAYYQAGQAVAAVHLGYKVRHISGNPAQSETQIVLPRNDAKPWMILWLTGLAAEKKGHWAEQSIAADAEQGADSAQIELVMETLKGSRVKRLKEARNLLNQAQDRANSICADLYEAIRQVAELLAVSERVEGSDIAAIVRAVKAGQRAKAELRA